MRTSLVLFAVVLACSMVFVGCAPSDQGGDYKEPEQGSFKTSEQVPERGGRSRSGESGVTAPGSGRSEGG